MTQSSSTSSAHTPGPWYFDWLGDERGWILDNQANYIAEIVTHDEMGFYVSEDQQKANARLIAAAPETAKERDGLKVLNAELLDACKQVLDAQIDFALCEREFRILSSVIAKAEGR